MATVARISTPHDVRYTVIEDVDLITTDYGVLNIMYGMDSEKGPQRVVYAPGQWEKVMIDTVPDKE